MSLDGKVTTSAMCVAVASFLINLHVARWYQSQVFFRLLPSLMQRHVFTWFLRVQMFGIFFETWLCHCAKRCVMCQPYMCGSRLKLLGSDSRKRHSLTSQELLLISLSRGLIQAESWRPALTHRMDCFAWIERKLAQYSWLCYHN